MLADIIRTGDREWPIDEDWRINDRGEFYQVTTWLDRAWHWLCDVCTNRTAVRTARVFNEIYSQLGPVLMRYINTSMDQVPDRSGTEVMRGLRIIQGYVSAQDAVFLERMQSVDEAFRKNWVRWTHSWPNAGQALILHQTIIDLTARVTALTERCTHLQLLQNQDYLDSCIVDAQKPLVNQIEILTQQLKKFEEAEAKLKCEDTSQHLDAEALRQKWLELFDKKST